MIHWVKVEGDARPAERWRTVCRGVSAEVVRVEFARHPVTAVVKVAGLEVASDGFDELNPAYAFVEEILLGLIAEMVEILQGKG